MSKLKISVTTVENGPLAIAGSNFILLKRRGRQIAMTMEHKIVEKIDIPKIKLT